MSDLIRSFRFGLRMIAKQPGVSAIAIVALALGIGLTTTMWSIVHAALADPPFPDGERVWRLSRTNPEQGIESQSLPQHDYVDYLASQGSFEALGAFYEGTINVAGRDRPMRFNGAFVTVSAMRIAGAEVVAGRLFAADDERPGADPVLLLGYDAWQTQYGGDAGIVGSEVRVNGRPGTVIGVLAPGFEFPMNAEAWMPLQIDLGALARNLGTWVDVVGKLREGVSLEAGLADLNGIAARIADAYPELNEGVRIRADRYASRFIPDEVMLTLWTMQGAVFMVLVIACANVANLLLSRAWDRSKEVAVRAAMGAGRLRIVSQFMIEVLVLALIGGAIGLGIARVGIALFNEAMVGVDKPYWIQVGLNPTVLTVSASLVLVASLIAGIVPALQVSRSNLADVLKDESRGSSGLRMGRIARGLVVLEMALSCGLLVGAGLMIKSVAQLATFDFGFPTRSVFTARIALFEASYPEREQRHQFYRDLQERLQAAPAARAVSLTSALPGTGFAGMVRLAMEGESYPSNEARPLVNHAVISPGFFDTFDVRVLAGRDFNVDDVTGALPVAIVNRSFVDRVIGGRDPLGARVRFGGEESPLPWLTIVGVVPDMSMEGLQSSGRRSPQGVYTPVAQDDRNFMSIALLTEGDPLEMASVVRNEVAGLDPDMPIYWPQALQTSLEQETWYYRIFGKLFAAFGAAALFLATIGLYGVISFAVRRRTAEVGIRLALGARPADVLSLIVRQGFWQIGLGLVLGLGLAALAAGGLEAMLFQVSPRDAGVFGGIAAVLLVTGLAACAIPALRAARVDPLIALRTQ